ncbi:hypothetical protein ACOMHN_010531 [Nucella lapillus]
MDVYELKGLKLKAAFQCAAFPLSPSWCFAAPGGAGVGSICAAGPLETATQSGSSEHSPVKLPWDPCLQRTGSQTWSASQSGLVQSRQTGRRKGWSLLSCTYTDFFISSFNLEFLHILL